MEVYPSVEYGADLDDMPVCASRVTPAIFEKSGINIFSGDMDSSSDYILLCGSVLSSSGLAFKTSYTSSFIAVYHRFIALKFHLTFEIGTYYT